MPLFGVVNSTLTLIKVPSGKNMKKTRKMPETPKSKKTYFQAFGGVGCGCFTCGLIRTSHDTGIYPLYVFFGCRTGTGSVSFQSLFPIPKSEI